MKINTLSDSRKRRHLRVRRKIRGTADRPRLCVTITNKHIYAQFVDDDGGAVLAAVSTLNEEGFRGVNVAAAEKLGQKAAAAALAKGIKTAVFDRGGRKYHGRVRAIPEAVRAAGIKI